MIQHATTNTTATPQYECESCLHRISAERNPTSCPECESQMHNISVPRE